MKTGFGGHFYEENGCLVAMETHELHTHTSKFCSLCCCIQYYSKLWTSNPLLVILSFLCCSTGVLIAILNQKMAAWLPWKQGNHSKMLAHYVAHLTCSWIECEKICRYITFIPDLFYISIAPISVPFANIEYIWENDYKIGLHLLLKKRCNLSTSYPILMIYMSF